MADNQLSISSFSQDSLSKFKKDFHDFEKSKDLSPLIDINPEWFSDFSFERAEGSLFTTRSISSHLLRNEVTKRGMKFVDSVIHNKSLLDFHPLYVNNPLIKQLYDMDYPISSINSIIKCGLVDRYLVRECCCSGIEGKKPIPVNHKCNLRVCPACSELRKKRIRKRYIPFLHQCKPNRSLKLYFVTASPENYSNLEYGLKDVMKTSQKWRRSDYFKKRVVAGLSVLEVKRVKKGQPIVDRRTNEFLYYAEKTSWNIHLHFILYSRRLDNQLRGYCNDCHQNLIKYDRNSNLFYCASKKCGSYNVNVKHTDTALVRSWKNSSKGRSCMFDVQEIENPRRKGLTTAINYLTKYISINKGELGDTSDLALYIKSTRKKRLINMFGKLYGEKIPELKSKCLCKRCNQEVRFYYDLKAVRELREYMDLRFRKFDAMVNLPPPKYIHIEEKLPSWCFSTPLKVDLK